MPAFKRVSQLPPKTLATLNSSFTGNKQEISVNTNKMPDVHKVVEKLNTEANSRYNIQATSSVSGILQPTQIFKQLNSPDTSNLKQGQLASPSISHIGLQSGTTATFASSNTFSRPGIQGAATVAYGLPTIPHYGGQSLSNLNRSGMIIQPGGASQVQNNITVRSISTEKIGQYTPISSIKGVGQETPSFAKLGQVGTSEGSHRFFSVVGNSQTAGAIQTYTSGHTVEAKAITPYTPDTNEYQNRLSHARNDSRHQEGRRNRSSSNSLGRFRTTTYHPDIGKTVISTTTVYRDMVNRDNDAHNHDMNASEHSMTNTGQGFSSIRPSNNTYDQQRAYRTSEAAFDQSTVSRRLSNYSVSQQYRPILPPTEIVTTIEDGDRTHHYDTHTQYIQAGERINMGPTIRQSDQSPNQKPGSLSLANAFKTHQLSSGPLNSLATKLTYISAGQSGNFQASGPSYQTWSNQSRDQGKSMERKVNPLTQTPFR